MGFTLCTWNITPNFLFATESEKEKMKKSKKGKMERERYMKGRKGSCPLER